MTDQQADLFAAPILPGLSLAPDVVTGGEEAALIEGIEATALSPVRYKGWFGKRMIASFGWHYDFERAELAPADPIPPFLQPLLERAAGFAGLDAAALEQALLMRYDPGVKIGWHRDRPVFGEVVGVSLGVAAVLRFRKCGGAGFGRAALPLAPRSIYHMRGEARHGWEHSIAEMAVRRWSVTFRSLVKGKHT